jgi:periplasmic protein CpxP/Spy
MRPFPPAFAPRRIIGLPVLLLAASAALATGPALAQTATQTGNQTPPPAATQPAPQPSVAAPADAAQPITSGTLQTKLGKQKATQIESHIAALHRSLGITAQQEPLWQNFANAMRENVVQMDAAYAERQNQYGQMSAVQDLESYGRVEETNARNVQQLLPPFRALYDSFSPAQKKAADSTFHRYTEKAVKKSG